MDGRIDIHQFKKKLERTIAFVRSGAVSPRSRSKKPISKRNADLILEYDQVRALEGRRAPTRLADMGRLIEVARVLDKDFDQASKADIKRMIVTIDARLAAWSRCKLRMTFKRFYKWMRQGDDYRTAEDFPEEVRWIRRGIGKRDQPRVQRGDCWSEKDIERFVAAALNPRDRALASLFTETGARVGELGSLRIRDVYQDEFGFLLHLSGKTGEREDRVIYSGPALANWLNAHPSRDMPSAPLFTHLRSAKPLHYQRIRHVLHELARRAGVVDKPCNPHIFRHSRATLLAEQGWPEPIIKQYLGWEKDSDMMSTYSHLTSRQANAYLLKSHGIRAKQNVESTLKAQLCATCHAQNGPEAKFCRRCGRPLGQKTMLEYNHAKKLAYDVLNQLADDPRFKELVEEYTSRKHGVHETGGQPTA